jgi:hypothetical protein
MMIKKDSEVSEVLSMIRAGRAKAYKAVNVALIDTYWAVGECASRKVTKTGWGNGVVNELANWLLARSPDLKDFSASSLWTMWQFQSRKFEQTTHGYLIAALSDVVLSSRTIQVSRVEVPILATAFRNL